MIIALLFVIVFVIGIALIPLGWFTGGYDVKTAFILWFWILATLYVFDAKMIADIFVTDFQYFSSLPWSGYP